MKNRLNSLNKELTLHNKTTGNTKTSAFKSNPCNYPSVVPLA